jgi:hypothetical protein
MVKSGYVDRECDSMVRSKQVPLLRAMANAALQQNELTPSAYTGLLQWLENMEQQARAPVDSSVIRQASELIIHRVNAANPV